MVAFRSLCCCLLLAPLVSSFVLSDGTTKRIVVSLPLSEKFKNDDEGEAGALAMVTSSRRAILAATTVAWAATAQPPRAAAAKPNGLTLQTAPTSGLQWADAKLGSGVPPRAGTSVAIDYSMASTAGRFPSIYSTKNAGAPYRWTLGDGSTIAGIELAVLGDPDEGIPPMLPGGVRRIIVPNTLGFDALIRQAGARSPTSKNERCLPGGPGSVGPIPPKDAPDGAYQRWYQFYCNPRIPYQPDLVLDIKLYRGRS